MNNMGMKMTKIAINKIWEAQLIIKISIKSQKKTHHLKVKQIIQLYSRMKMRSIQRKKLMLDKA